MISTVIHVLFIDCCSRIAFVIRGFANAFIIIICGQSEGMMSIPLANGNVMKVPVNPINISEEVNRSGVWMDINKDQEKKPPNSPTKNR